MTPVVKVKTGTETILTCTVTGITAGFTIETSWYDGDTQLSDSTAGEYSARKLQG